METSGLKKRISRRSVVKTGGKLAYAAPLVAASFKLSSHGADAVTAVCPAGYTFVAIGPHTGPATCCKCACTTFTGTLVQSADGPHCVDPQGPFDTCLTCTGLVQSLFVLGR